uniref:Multiprotein bridging factor 1 N-terminal domain-containing protein n=1 Tax=Laticauda laticaudata TaxID=8630 RepID=A0A8C5SI98_LATLA
MAESDWDMVTVLHKKRPSAAQDKSKQAVLAAQRKGEDVETSKKWAADPEGPDHENQREAQVITDYKSGKAIPNHQVLRKIERAISLKLQGRDISRPLKKAPKGR